MKLRVWAIASVLILLPALVLAQASGTGTVTGRIVDSSGGVLPGVAVTLRSLQALGQFTAVTDAQGQYRIGKSFTLGPSQKMELSADAFNVFNSPAAFGFLSADARSANFGVKTNFVQPRVGQIGIRFVF